MTRSSDKDNSSQGTSPTRSRTGKRSRITSADNDEEESCGEANVPGSVGSNDDLDHLDEDLMRSSEARKIGYFGKNSNVQWLSSVQRQTEHTTELRDEPYGSPGSTNEHIHEQPKALSKRLDNPKKFAEQRSIVNTSFYLDNEEMPTDIFVDPYEKPEPETAIRLFHCYLKTVHSSYPLVSYLLKLVMF